VVMSEENKRTGLIRGILFLISRSGVPRHWTTSVNNGDTSNADIEPITSSARDKLPTIISHRYIGDNFLQDGFPLDKLLVFRLCRLEICAKFLGDKHSDHDENRKKGWYTDFYLSSLKELGILTSLSHSGLRRSPHF